MTDHSREGLASGCATGLPMEEWRRVSLSPYRAYEVSSLGRVRRRARVLSPVQTKDGYATIQLFYAGLGKRFRINRLVCHEFHGAPPSEGMDAAHLDGDRKNDSAANLVWKARKDNIADKIGHGTHQAGERHGCAKLTASDVAAIRERAAAGEGNTSIAKSFCVSDVQILRIVKHQRWSTVS